MPWAASAAAALDLAPPALVEQALGGLAERGLVVSEGGRFDTTIPHEERSPPAVGPGDPTRWPERQD
jgi:hypothetical protein